MPAAPLDKLSRFFDAYHSPPGQRTASHDAFRGVPPVNAGDGYGQRADEEQQGSQEAKSRQGEDQDRSLGLQARPGQGGVRSEFPSQEVIIPKDIPLPSGIAADALIAGAWR